MKKTIFVLTVLAAAFVWSCDDGENSGGGAVGTRARRALEERYPGATNVSWEMKGIYAVADFMLSGVPNSGWFDNDGAWYMTESDIPFASLPQPVQDAFLGGEYGSWKVDDVDRIEREGAETVYVIEAERGDEEVDLYYAPDGVLVKTVAGEEPDYDYGDFIPDTVNESIYAFLKERYPEARIVEVEAEDGGIEVEIVDGRFCREVFFTAAAQWVRTKTGLRLSDVPDAVMQALAASEYSSYHIDDVDLYETPAGTFYRFELEGARGDIKIDITPDGTVSAAEGGQNEGGALPQSVRDFIADKYPGAVITDTDYAHGFLEVEIVHENTEKDVYFDGSDGWVATEWDVLPSQLPAEVTAAIQASPYAGYEIDDVDYVQTPAGDYYRVELERGDSEAVLEITPSGQVR